MFKIMFRYLQKTSFMTFFNFKFMKNLEQCFPGGRGSVVNSRTFRRDCDYLFMTGLVK